MKCAICMQDRPRLKFRTGRISICPFCVVAINNAEMSAREAGALYIAKWRRAVIRFRPEAAAWPLTWFERRLPEHMRQERRVRRSVELRLLRAYQRRLVCLDRRYLAYPADWTTRRFAIKQMDDFRCHRCGRAEGNRQPLHVHHIIHRSRSGTNAQQNLVALCARCHQAQHPGLVIGADHGEPAGVDIDHEATATRPLEWPVLRAGEPPATADRFQTASPAQPAAAVRASPVPCQFPESPELPEPTESTRPPTHPIPVAPEAMPSNASFMTAGYILLGVVVAIAAIFARPQYTKRGQPETQIAQSYKAEAEIQVISPNAPTAAPSVPQTSPPVSAAEQWRAAAALFIATRCELADQRPEVRSEVARNYRIFQRALDELHGKPWSNQQLLAIAGEQVYHDPAYTPRGHCPK